jgi:signal transduction histidine kinase
MVDALARRRQAQLAYLAGVAHDLRTPLSVLELTIGMLGPDRSLPPEPRLRELIGRVRRQVVRLGRMTEDLTDAARIESGRLELRRAPHDLREVAAVVADLFVDASTPHELEVVAPDQPVLVDGDPLRLEQVLINLVSNAIKYSPAGGKVVISILRDDRDCVLKVSDQGIGMTEGEVDRMFEPFQRIAGVSDQLPGAGLGMWIVRRIIEAHGGRIQVYSNRGQGTTMEVRLPCADAADQPAERSLAVGLP